MILLLERRNKEFYLLNACLITLLLLIVLFSPLRPTDEILLYTSDAQTYLGAGEEVFSLNKQGFSWTRPYLYSSFLYWGYQIGGSKLIVIAQSFFWLLTANFIYYGVRFISNKKWIQIVAVSLFAINLSLISYIFHGLTEVLSTLLLSIFVYITLKAKTKQFDAYYFVLSTIIFALLTVIKPLFYYPFLVFSIVTIFFHLKTILKTKKLVILLLSAFLIIGTQFFIMYKKYDVIKISAISGLTFDNYILAQGIRKLNDIDDIELSQELARNLSSQEKKKLIFENKSTFLNLYLTNLKDNITGYGTNIILPAKFDVKTYVTFGSEYNKILYVCFLILLPIYIIFCFIDIFLRKIKHLEFIFIGLLFYYIVFSSGISFFQADRLVLFAIPLWIILYIILIQRMIKVFRRKNNFQ